MIKKIYIAFFIALFFCVSNLYAQKGNPSVYTSFGIGRLENSGLLKNQNMGGSGLAMPSSDFINVLNPASLAGLDSLNMLIDLGVGLGTTNYKTNNVSGNSYHGGLGNISLAFRSSKYTFTGFGLSQYSSVAYNVNTSANVVGSFEEISKSYLGDGGVNEVYLSNAFKINENIYLGAKVSYLFGNITKTESYLGESLGGSLNINYADYLKQFSYELGGQYGFTFNDYKVRVGATYSPGFEFVTNREVTAGSENGTGNREKLEDTPYEVPDNMAGGISVSKNGFVFALDYRLQDWTKIKYNNSVADLKESQRYSGGLEYRNLSTKRANPYIWQIGGYFENSYIRLDGKTIYDAGINLGVAIPLKVRNQYDNKGYVNIGLNAGRRGSDGKGLITERYYGLSVSLSLVEFWFRKRQFD